MRTNTDGEWNLNGILAALYYLSKEAERAERPDVSGIIRGAIMGISAIGEMSGQELERNRGLTSETTCTVLEFFDHYLRASPAARASFLESLCVGVGAS